ncbi:hypothetical protein ABT369_39365 [Dactylosporangium sp. NPDC000244]|uniref:hypothetical protein n=1 Tax=Dactylosporangium sp. NPDC000244 TaxID=3154365 RepID=UPI003331EA58
MTALAALPHRETVACRGRIVALDEHVSHQGLPWASGVVESPSGEDRFEVWPVPYRSAGKLSVGARVAFVAVVDLERAAEPVLLVRQVEVLA